MTPPENPTPHAPPRHWRAIVALIRRVAPSRDQEAFLGDLIEEWETVIRPQRGPRRAWCWLWRQTLGSLPALLRMRLSQEVSMTPKPTMRAVLGHRLSSEAADARFSLATCVIAGVAIVPLAIVALLRNHSGPAEFLLGVGLALVSSVIFLMMGLVSRAIATRINQVPWRRRGAEFLSYLAGPGLLIGGLCTLPTLGLTPAGIVLMLLLLASLSIAVLVLGMMTTLYLVSKQT